MCGLAGADLEAMGYPDSAYVSLKAVIGHKDHAGRYSITKEWR